MTRDGGSAGRQAESGVVRRTGAADTPGRGRPADRLKRLKRRLGKSTVA